MKHLFIFFLFTIYSCATVNNNLSKIKGSYLSFERSACYGKCPVFKITIKNNGDFEYLGKLWVDNIGKFNGRLSNQKTNNLFNKLKTYDWKSYPNEYPLDNTDFPSFTIEYSDGKFVEKIKGNTNASKELIELSKMLDNLIKGINMIENSKN